ncbi:MAG: hypothetical protein AMXMBFR49_13450 [Chlorobiota bacterium]
MTQKYYRLIDLLSSVISGEWGLEPLEEGSVSIIRTTNFLNNGKINFDNTVKRFVDSGTVSKKKLQSGDVIIEKSGGSPNQPVGRVVYFEKPDDKNYLCNNFTTILRADARISSKYLFYWLYYNHLIKRTLTYQNKTTGIINLQLTRYLESEKILLPSFEEQHRIVKILDLAQSLIEKRKKAIAYLDDYIKAVFLDMFGDPVSNPKGWEVNKLSKVCTKIADGTHFSPPLVESGIPYVTAKHLKSSGIDFFKNPTYISQEEHNKIFARCTPEKGDVLYIKDGATTGIAAINYYDFEFSMLSSLALLKPNKNLINNHYLCHWLNNPQVKFKLLQQMAGVAIQRFTLTKINNFTLPVPPIAEQENFAKIVEKTNSIQKSMQSQLEELENNFQAELQRAFRQD